MMATLSNENVKTRKPHRCGLCERTISPGSTARRCVVTDLGKAHSFYYHEECDRATVIDKWDEIDWECHASGADFVQRLEELREEGKLEPVNSGVRVTRGGEA